MATSFTKQVKETEECVNCDNWLTKKQKFCPRCKSKNESYEKHKWSYDKRKMR